MCIHLDGEQAERGLRRFRHIADNGERLILESLIHVRGVWIYIFTSNLLLTSLAMRTRVRTRRHTSFCITDTIMSLSTCA